MRAEVHVTGTMRRAADVAIRLLDNVAPIMLAAVEGAAARERDTHAYVNRTWNLENSTRGYLVYNFPNETCVAFEMGMYYASYVNRLGYSDFDFEAERAGEEIRAQLGSLLGGIGG